MTNEEIKKILDEAPDGAIYYQVNSYVDEMGLVWRDGRWVDFGWDGAGTPLSTLREILELRQEVEQLQQRNAELEAHLSAYKSIPEEALRQYRHNDNSGFVFAYDKGYVDGILTKAPQQNLNAVKREEFQAFQQWALDFFCSPDFEPLKRKVFRKLNGRVQGQVVMPHNDPEYCGLLALFSEYANNKYPTEGK